MNGDCTHEHRFQIRNRKSKILFLFTRTPLHIGAGASVGAIDQPIQRERHTGFPIIPATGLKGSFADQWPTTLRNEEDKTARVVESRLLKESDALCVQEAISSHGGAVLLRSPNITVARQRHPTGSVRRFMGSAKATDRAISDEVKVVTKKVEKDGKKEANRTGRSRTSMGSRNRTVRLDMPCPNAKSPQS